MWQTRETKAHAEPFGASWEQPLRLGLVLTILLAARCSVFRDGKEFVGGGIGRASSAVEPPPWRWRQKGGGGDGAGGGGGEGGREECAKASRSGGVLGWSRPSPAALARAVLARRVTGTHARGPAYSQEPSRGAWMKSIRAILRNKPLWWRRNCAHLPCRSSPPAAPPPPSGASPPLHQGATAEERPADVSPHRPPPPPAGGPTTRVAQRCPCPAATPTAIPPPPLRPPPLKRHAGTPPRGLPVEAAASPPHAARGRQWGRNKKTGKPPCR